MRNEGKRAYSEFNMGRPRNCDGLVIVRELPPKYKYVRAGSEAKALGAM